MKKLNQRSTKIFCQILKRLGSEQHCKLQSEGFMPLGIEKLQENLLTPWGVAITYSLSHTYLQNGDLMRDPEMVFLVIDNRNFDNNLRQLAVYPLMYQQDNLGLYEESVTIENGQIKSFIKLWQHSHCNFANFWLRNIQQQGFLK